MSKNCIVNNKIKKYNEIINKLKNEKYKMET